MSETQNNLPSNGFAFVVDGEVKTEFTTRGGVAKATVELKRRFPGSPDRRLRRTNQAIPSHGRYVLSSADSACRVFRRVTGLP
jgi:hypothetical protein